VGDALRTSGRRIKTLGQRKNACRQPICAALILMSARHIDPLGAALGGARVPPERGPDLDN